MDTTDGPVIAAFTTQAATEAAVGAVIGTAIGEGAKAVSGQPSIFGKGDQPSLASLPSRTAIGTEQETKTAEPITGLSEQAKTKRRRQASILTRGFEPPKLGILALTGA